jgi:hypothetical protein
MGDGLKSPDALTVVEVVPSETRNIWCYSKVGINVCVTGSYE